MRWTLVAASLLIAACASSDVGLEALRIEDRSALASYRPSAPGSRLVAVRIRLLNASLEAIPVDESLLVLELEGGRSVAGHPSTVAFDEACAGVVEVGVTVTCWVGFELPSGTLPTHVTYIYPGHRASAEVRLATDGPPIPVAPPEPLAPTDQLDLLLVIDNSGSLTEEQASLTFELPGLIERLASGDIDGDGRTDGPDDVPGLDLQIGVISTDMGVGGFTVPTCVRPDFGDDGILRTQGRTDIRGCLTEYPSFVSYHPGDDVEWFAHGVTCVATVGTGGCGFEQPLEAMLKSISPSAPTAAVSAGYRAPVFFRNTSGHGDAENAGFLRADSVLAVVVMTDEEDCSARDPDIFNPSSPTYGATDLNLRCFAHAEAAVHPIDRYVDGLLQLRARARRLVYFPLAGIPADLEPAPGEPPRWDLLVSEDPAQRDPRMQERVDPSNPSRLIPSCNVPGRGVAFAPVRLVRVAEQLERRGAQASVGSVCQESFAPAMDQLIQLVARAARGG
ncbi:MAG: hypothetical protein H6719_07710 [Sandaracinaceae bacterium]|nr:hypothetical protein [Sandaracinaceae bacterium]